MAIDTLTVSATSATEQIKNLVLANAAAHISSATPESALKSSAPDNTYDGVRKPYEIYNGGFSNAHERGVCIRIANGTAGQIGLIRLWADTFIRMMVEEKGEQPFEVSSNFSVGKAKTSYSSVIRIYLFIGRLVSGRHHRQSVNAGVWCCGYGAHVHPTS